jgi:hypothetical protein
MKSKLTQYAYEDNQRLVWVEARISEIENNGTCS